MRSIFGVLCLATAFGIASAAPAKAEQCDRTCLAAMADKLVNSVVRHDPKLVPLTRTYRATENGVAAGLPMMTIWHSVTGAQHKFYVIDPVSAQLFLVADIVEGSGHALLFGRVKVADGRFSEIELYVDRSRSDGGFQFDATALAHLPTAWTEPVAASRIPSRAALLQAGRAIFDTALSGPEPASTCLMMENGKPVAEDPEVLKIVGAGGPTLTPNADGSVPIPCGAPPIRPTDPEARTDIVDEVQGIVVSIATVHGMVQPYLITDPTISAFVPLSLAQPYLDLLAAQRKTGRFTRPELVPTPASVTVAQMHRYFDGKLQGMHLLEKLGSPGAYSPWAPAAR